MGHAFYMSFLAVFVGWSMTTNVVHSVPFRPEQTENLVPVCKPVRDNPHSTSGKISECFGEFRGVSASMCISAGLLFGGN